MTPKQQRFVQEYLIDLNATQAAIRAGYSAKTATEQGSRLLTIVHVADAIAAGQRESAAKAGITRERILQGLLTEAVFYGEGATHGARVSAWSALGKLTEGEIQSMTVTIRKLG
jgi:phage terminase small subunit